MYIFDFEKFFYDTNLKKAQNLVSRNKITLTDSDESSYIFKTQETSESKQIINVDPFGNVQYMDCTCYDTWYCHHKAAALYMTAKLLKEKYNGSSPVVSFLTDHYSKSVVENAVSEASDRKIRLEPSLKNGRYGISLSLRIGYDKMYSVKNVMKLKENFMKMKTEIYGKNTSITHLYTNLDDDSAKLLDLAVSACVYAQHSLEAKNTSGLIPLQGEYLENFLTLLSDKEVIYENGLYNVRFEDVRLPLFITKTEDRKFSISFSDNGEDSRYTCIGQGRCMCFMDNHNRTLYVCSEKFKMYVSSFFNLLSRSQFQIIVSVQDMPAFFSSVLNPLHFALDIHGEELLKSFIPPEVQVNLYIDSPEPEVINGRLEFAYQYKSYQAFNGQKSNTRDLRTEAIAEKIVSKYFDVMENDLHHPLVVTGDNRIYDLLSAGIPELSKYMDIYASEKFNRMKIKTNPRISVGVHPESSLLEIDITSVEYTAEELAELLTSYRQGHKYHRLKDGSFTILDQSFADLDQLTRNLNIKDKSLLKDKIKVPLYRMLYLDSLNSSNSSLKFNRSSLFRSEIRKYRDMSASEDFSVDPSLSDIMREYQKHGFAWMKTICRYGFGGILADDMGLGKTLQAIALMLDLKNSDKENKKSLVVCPASLTLNWENEIMKFAPALSTAVIIGNTFQRAELFDTCMDKDVIITSYTTLTRDILEYNDITFGLHFIDEAQFIKNHSTQMAKAVKSIKSEIRFALTGTPVENSLAELWSIFDFIMPDYLFTYSYFKKTFENQIVKNHDEVSVYELQKLTSPFILRRMKKDVLTELPDKTITVLPVKMEGEQERIYLANLLELKKNLASGGMNDNEHRFRILAMLTRLRQICCDPSLVYENYESGSAKLTQCLDLVESCAESGHKVLLFSQFTSMLDIIRKNLEQKKISYCLLEGKTKPKDRISMVERFNSDDTKVFLISLKAGGTGLNLTSADIVIHYDPWWNASAENQATDRAYRIGQRNNVQVYKLITENTIEEKIQKLQKLKTELAELSLSGTSDLMALSSEEIIDLLDI